MSCTVAHRRGFRSLVAAALLLLAGAAGGTTAAKIPRFESLRVNDVNLRTGPGEQYPIQWVYHRKGLPVEIVGSFDVWRRVRDSDGTRGWMHQRMLTPTRSVIIEGQLRSLRSAPRESAAVVARAEPGAVAHLLECPGAWCRVEAQDITGWLPRGDLWGLFPDETVP